MWRSIVATQRPTGSWCVCGPRLKNTSQTVIDSSDRVNRVHGRASKAAGVPLPLQLDRAFGAEPTTARWRQEGPSTPRVTGPCKNLHILRPRRAPGLAGKAPAHPVAQGFAHDQLEIAALQPGQLLGE